MRNRAEVIAFFIVGTLVVFLFHGLEYVLKSVPLALRMIIEIVFWSIGLMTNMTYSRKKGKS